jgi:hypothetical protein
MARTGRRTKTNKKTPKDVTPREPYELSPIQRRAIKFLSQNGYRPGQSSRSGVLKACHELFDIGRTTLWAWLKIPEFREELVSQAEFCLEQVMKGANVALAQGNPTVIAMFLEAFLPDVYDRKRALMQLRHEQAMEMEKFRAEQRLSNPLEEDLEIKFIETGQGERIAIEAPDADD